MNIKLKTLALSAAIIMGVTTTAFASRLDMGPGQTGKNETLCGCSSISRGHQVGIIRKESSYGTEGISYVGCSGYYMFTQVNVGGRTLTGRGTSWAQTETLCRGIITTVSETHGLAQ
jgi:hypothetical protein